MPIRIIVNNFCTPAGNFATSLSAKQPLHLRREIFLHPAPDTPPPKTQPIPAAAGHRVNNSIIQGHHVHEQQSSFPERASVLYFRLPMNVSLEIKVPPKSLNRLQGRELAEL